MLYTALLTESARDPDKEDTAALSTSETLTDMSHIHMHFRTRIRGASAITHDPALPLDKYLEASYALIDNPDYPLPVTSVGREAVNYLSSYFTSMLSPPCEDSPNIQAWLSTPYFKDCMELDEDTKLLIDTNLGRLFFRGKSLPRPSHGLVRDLEEILGANPRAYHVPIQALMAHLGGSLEYKGTTPGPTSYFLKAFTLSLGCVVRDLLTERLPEGTTLIPFVYERLFAYMCLNTVEPAESIEELVLLQAQFLNYCLRLFNVLSALSLKYPRGIVPQVSHRVSHHRQIQVMEVPEALESIRTAMLAGFPITYLTSYGAVLSPLMLCLSQVKNYAYFELVQEFAERYQEDQRDLPAIGGLEASIVTVPALRMLVTGKYNAMAATTTIDHTLAEKKVDVPTLPPHLNVLSVRDRNTVRIPYFIHQEAYGAYSILVPASLRTTNVLLTVYGQPKNDYLAKYGPFAERLLTLSTATGLTVLSNRFELIVGVSVQTLSTLHFWERVDIRPILGVPATTELREDDVFLRYLITPISSEGLGIFIDQAVPDRALEN